MSVSNAAFVRPQSAAERTNEFVTASVQALQEQYMRKPQPTSTARAALARLRRGLGKPIGEIPDLLEFTIDPKAPAAVSDAPTRSEIAAHTALTLYGLHQQSQRGGMHDLRQTFAQAVGSLRFRNGDEIAGILRRFQALATATDMAEFVQHTRGLIALLRSAERGFHYGKFAADLVHFQNPALADRVRLAWGRDFYRFTASSETSEETS